MRNELSSRELLMLTINHCEPDHVPLLFPNFPPPLAPACSYTKFQEAEYFLKLGIDATIRLDPPMFFPSATRALGRTSKRGHRQEVLRRHHG